MNISEPVAGARSPATSTPRLLPRVTGRTRGPRPRYTPEEVIDALMATNGVMSRAGKMLRCSGNTVGNYIQAYPEVRAAHERIIADRTAARA